MTVLKAAKVNTSFPTTFVMLILWSIPAVLSLTLAAHAQVAPPILFQALGTSFKSPVVVAPGLVAHVVFSNLTSPRGIAFDSSQNLLVVERGFGVTAFSPVVSPTPGWSRTVVVANENLTHGIQIDGTKLYVSTGGDAFVYNYSPATKSIDPSFPPYSIVSGIPADGELTTHTLELEKDSSGKTIALLIGSGPLTNIDVTARNPFSGRSQVRRFAFPHIQIATHPPPSIPWASGQILAFGIRNPGGFTFSPFPSPSQSITKQLYVVENGASIDNVTGLTAAFVNDNPADELELVSYQASSSGSIPTLGKFYGFPDCASLWNPKADPVGVPQYVNVRRGDQFSLHLDGTRDDAWCQTPANNKPPILNFQAHSVPLDIKFYTPSVSNADSNTALSTKFGGDAFVSFHGSFDRTPPTGYGVVRVPFPLNQPAASSALGYSFLIQAANLTSCPGICIRPVGLSFSVDGKLYVSSDSSGELFVVERASTL